MGSLSAKHSLQSPPKKHNFLLTILQLSTFLSHPSVHPAHLTILVTNYLSTLHSWAKSAPCRAGSPMSSTRFTHTNTGFNFRLQNNLGSSPVVVLGMGFASAHQPNKRVSIWTTGNFRHAVPFVLVIPCKHRLNAATNRSQAQYGSRTTLSTIPSAAE